MKKLIQLFIFLMVCSFAATPVIAKDSTTTSSKSSKSKKAKKTKASKSNKTSSKKVSKTKPAKKSSKKISTSTQQSSDSITSSKSKKSSGDSQTRASKSSKSSDSSSGSTSRSSKSTKKKTAKSKLKGTDKAKQFKNITVNINKADAATMAHFLVGIGETRAKAIVKYRKKNGKFKSNEGLMQVPGIGEAIYAGLKKNVSPSRGETSVPKGTSSTSSSSTSTKKTTKKK